MNEPSLARRTLVITAVALATVATAVVLWMSIPVLLVGFAAILYAILLSGLARLLSDHTPLPYPLCLAGGLVATSGFLIGAGFLLGPRVAVELDRLVELAPDAIDRIRGTLDDYGWGRAVLDQAPSADSVKLAPSGVLGEAAGVFSTAASIVTNALVVLIVGLYMAFSPGRYVEIPVRLLPPSKRARGREVLLTLGLVLRRWLVGRAASMAVVGVLTWIGLTVLGVRLSLVLAVLAAVLSFVPNLGPVLSVIPAMLLGLLDSPAMAGYVALLYLGVQLFESYLITPLIEQRAVSLPPALLIMAQLLFGVLLGVPGLIIATPLVVVGVVLVQMLYLQDVLGDPIEVVGASPQDGAGE
ncbi:MAG TPA: AI-2E family transporter [Kofleriaceae bacterium]|nr:AI-2E family transporter [Kofleriaceae bacterium]